MISEASNKKILQGPKNVVFEHVASEFAAVWWETGMSQGMSSKYKDARSFARANFEKFIPQAIKHCVTLLGRQDIPDLAKAEIYEALHERNNDPDVNTMLGYGLPDLDVKKILDMLPKQERIANVNTIGSVNDQSVLHMKKINPYLKVN